MLKFSTGTAPNFSMTIVIKLGPEAARALELLATLRLRTAPHTEEARRTKADLLVMGSHGRSGIGSGMGSIAYGVLQSESRVSILVVRK